MISGVVTSFCVASPWVAGSLLVSVGILLFLRNKERFARIAGALGLLQMVALLVLGAPLSTIGWVFVCYTMSSAIGYRKVKLLADVADVADVADLRRELGEVKEQLLQKELARSEQARLAAENIAERLLVTRERDDLLAKTVDLQQQLRIANAGLQQVVAENRRRILNLFAEAEGI